jgi:hypothetical protein
VRRKGMIGGVKLRFVEIPMNTLKKNVEKRKERRKEKEEGQRLEMNLFPSTLFLFFSLLLLIVLQCWWRKEWKLKNKRQESLSTKRRKK